MFSAFRDKTVLVLGGTGFIGSHLVNTLLNKGAKIIIVGNSANHPTVLNAQYKCCDVSNCVDITACISDQQFDYVFNLSGYINHSEFADQGWKMLQDHFLGVTNVIRVLDRSKLKAFVQVGTSDVYKNNSTALSEDSELGPISCYSMAKLASEQLITMLHQTEDFPGVCVRLFLVYGPGQSDNRFIPQIIKGCLNDEKFPCSPGEQLRDFCYVDDIVEGLMLAAIKPEAKGEVINLASGNPIKIKDMVNLLQTKIDSGNPQFGEIHYRKNEAMSLYANIDKAHQLLGWKPKVNLNLGLENTIKYYENAKTQLMEEIK